MDYKEVFNELYHLRERIKDNPRYYINDRRPAVCSDDALRLIARYKPTTIEELSNVAGIGDKFKSEYGEMFVKKIRELTDKKAISLDAKKKDLLSRLENRLVDINQRNKLIYSGKINKEFGVDLFGYLEKPDEFIKYVLSQSTAKYKIINVTDVEEDKTKGLLKLIRQVDRIETETGTNELYLAYPFLQGKFENEDINVKAPLILFPIRLERDSEKVSIINDTSRDIIYNTTLILANNKFNKKNKVLPDSNISEFNKDTYLTDMLKFYEENELYIQANDNIKSEKFFENRKSEFPHYNNGMYEIKGYMVLGLYSMSVTPLYADFHKIIESNEITKRIEELLDGMEQPITTEEVADSVDENKDEQKLEEKISYINNLDYSQEKVLEAIGEKEAIVVQGPPGTGKSQTITNIIVEAIQADKNVLMVSEKKTALDVIYSRLGKLSKFAMIVDDVKDKNEFYKQLIAIIENYTTEQEVDIDEEKLKNSIQKIEENLEMLDEIGRKIYEKTDFGVSMYDLYQECKKINEKKKSDMEVYDYLLSNLNGNISSSISYKDLKRLKEKFSNEKISSCSYEYTTLLNDDVISFLGCIKDNLTSNDLNHLETDVNKFVEQKQIYDTFNMFKKMFNKKIINMPVEEIINKYFNYESDAEYRNIKNGVINSFSNILEFIPSYGDYIDNKFIYNKLDTLEKEYFDEIKKFHDNNEYHGSLLEDNDTIFNHILYCKILTFERDNPEVIRYISDFDNIINDISDNIEKKKECLKETSYLKLWETFSNIKKNGRASKILDICNRSRKMSVNKFAKTYWLELFDSINIWLMTPEVVAELLPFRKDLFDIVIFDEASQLYVERSLSAIYRGKKIVVAGDQKQLRPSSLGKGRILDDIDEDAMMDNGDDFLEYESLLDAANYKYYRTMLNYHYRSRYEELINFSNYAFYHGKLMITTNANVSKEIPIERIKVENGKWIDKKNDEEAKEVVKLVKKILYTRKNDETIGVITFNVTQMYLIEDYLEKERAKDVDFNTKLSVEEKRTEDGQNIGFFVKNIETVQGDERDIIIFCIGYAKNETGRVVTQFGWLNQTGGENRLNVAISRAKEKIYIITSIEPEELHVEDAKNNGPKLFKKYLEYTKLVSEGRNEEVKLLLADLIDVEANDDKNIQYDSIFEEEVYDKLTELGYDVITQYGVGGYKIDLVVRDKNKNNVLGIECDGRLYHSSKIARERDYHRQKYLESRGWKIYRIWSTNWWNNPEAELRKIDKYLKTIIN